MRKRPALWSRAARLSGGLLLALLLQACATRAPRSAPAPEPALGEARARQIVAVWQHQLGDYIMQAGGGDPAVLAQLPTLRTTGTLRPARISFGVLDVDASTAERDGFDVQGLLLDAGPAAAAEPYVFVVGIVRREGYRPLALVDIRLVALSLQDGRPQWTVGEGDAQALARYRARLDPTATLRFPADHDRFEVVACAVGICAEERVSAARWSLAAHAPAGTTPPS